MVRCSNANNKSNTIANNTIKNDYHKENNNLNLVMRYLVVIESSFIPK